MNPRLVSCYFGAGVSDQWTRLARVLRWTAAKQCQGWDIDIRAITPEPLRSAVGVESHVANTQKMDFWVEAVRASSDGQRLLLIDADTMILQPLDDVWDRPFDVAYTTKDSRFPFNSGVVFMRVSDRVRAFADAWHRENRRMLNDAVHHMTWRRKYGGINQAALGYMLDSQMAVGLQLVTLPCAEWNCEDSSWLTYAPSSTRIVHIKSALRRTVFGIGGAVPKLRTLKKVWIDLEREALSQAPPPSDHQSSVVCGSV